MNYSESLERIRAARLQREEAKAKLYSLQMNYVKLSRDQKKAAARDIIATAGNERSAALDQTLASVQAELGRLNNTATARAMALKRMEELQALPRQIQQETERLQTKKAGIQNELRHGEITDRDKVILQQQIAAVDGDLAALKQREEAIAAETKKLRADLAGLPSDEEAARAKAGLQKKIQDLQAEKAKLTNANGSYREDKSRELIGLKENIKAGLVASKQLGDKVNILIDNLHAELSPQLLIEQWDDSQPIALLPLRLETKFRTRDTVRELLVRVFPDDAAIMNHEKTLTDKEVEWGGAHWKALFEAGTNAQKKREAWRLLTDRFGINRGAWVARETKPLNWADRATLPSAAGLSFPKIALTKPDAWTQAPHTRVLPDRFVLMAYRAKKQVLMQVSKPVKDIVVTGPAPVEDGDNPSLTRNSKTKRINYGEDFAWIADFDLAVASGLGFIVKLDAAAQQSGFDQLLVAGVKLSANEADGKLLLEDLLTNHRYSDEGLSLVQQGTPTNNTEDADAGYSKTQSADDIAAMIETNSVLFTPSAKAEEATDGQRLAELLGIEYGVLQTVTNSDLRDYGEAVAMNKAMYAGTLGYYMNSMMADVLDDENRQLLRRHFTESVTGRGPLASIRIGNQPYGIIVTSAFSQWAYGISSEGVTAKGLFYNKLYQVLTYLSGQWKLQVDKLAYVGKGSNAADTIMKVLGLQPASAEFYQRNGYSFDYLKNMDEFSANGKYLVDEMGMLLEGMNVNNILKTLGYNQKKPNGTYKPFPLLTQLIFQHYHTMLDSKNLVDSEPLSEEHTVKPYDAAANYIDWLLLNAGDEKALEAEKFGGPGPKPLLYMMLRYALLQEAGQSIYHYLNQNNISANEIIQSRKFMNISAAPSVSPWEIFRAPVNQLVTTQTSSLSLFGYVNSPAFPFQIINYLPEMKAALSVLKAMPTARLERVFTEHIDTLSYRLDAWQTSLFSQRLQAQRQTANGIDKRKKGIYLGAYGYLENIKPGNKRMKVNDDYLVPALREGKDNLFLEQGNGGYVQAPTLNHATAAAILRNGYLTHANAADKDTLAVNLSSARVRRAKYLLEGIRNGQTLEALLGYQFERGLHDWTTRVADPVILDQFIPVFRKAFPIKKTKVPQQGKTTGPEEVTDDFSVVNGLALVNAASPFVSGLPVLSKAQKAAIQQEKDKIANTLDAMKDLLTAESAYQMASGNFERAAAVMQSVANAGAPPEIEVINSARSTALSFTHRVVIHFDADLTANPWPAVAMNQKSLTEPGLNHWIGGLLGDPARISCTVRAVNEAGAVCKREDGSEVTGSVTLQDLQLQPLDFVLLIRNKLEASGTSELESRIRYLFCQKEGLDDTAIIRISFAETPDPKDAALRSFTEILPFANYIRELICSAKTLHARDYEPASKIKTVAADNVANINTDELLTRVEAVYAVCQTVAAHLSAAVADAASLKTEAAIEAIRTKLKAFADAGYVYAFPQSSFGSGEAAAELLTEQAQSVLQRFEALQKGYTANHTKLTAIVRPDEKAALLTTMIKSLLGDDYVIMPRFHFNNTADVAQAYATKDDILTYAKNNLQMPLPVTEWLHGASLVRPKMHTLEMVRLLNDNFNENYLQAAPVQLPYRLNDSWLGVEYPEGTTIDHDTLSFVQYTPQGFNAAATQCGLLFDDWVEAIPNKEEVTGITFNYNQPNSTPPQAILLAVTPKETGRWSWDKLTATILDTFDRAKERAIEPDHIDTMNGLTTLLPATIAEFSASPLTHISLDYSMSISTKFDKVLSVSLDN